MALTQEERDLLFGGDSQVATEELATSIERKALTGDSRAPAQQAIDFLSDPKENLLKPFSALSMDVVSGLNTGIAGAAQALGEVSSLVPVGLNWLFGQESFDMLDRESFLENNITAPEVARQEAYAQYRKNLTGEEPSNVATVLGELLPSLAVAPNKAAASLFGRLYQSAAFGGLSGGLEFTEGGSSQKAINTMLGVALGAPVQALVEGAVKGTRFVSPAKLKKITVNNPTATDVLTRSETIQVLQSAERLGITVTPAEATGDLLLINGQRQLNVNEATRGELGEFLLQRNDDLTENILQLQRVADRDLQYTGTTFKPANSSTGEGVPDRAPFIGKQDEVNWKKTRQEVYRQSLDQEELATVLNSSPLLQRQFIKYQTALKTKPTKRTDEHVLALESINKLKKDLGLVGDIPFNNVGFLDMLIDNLDEVVDKGVDATTPAGRKKLALISNQRKALSSTLKKKVSGYASMKGQGQRALAVSLLRNAVDEGTTSAADYPKKFFDSVLKDKKKREELINILKPNDPDIANKVGDLGLVMSHIFSDANIANKISQSAEDIATQSTGGAGVVGSLGIVYVKVRALLKQDEAMIRVLTDPDWSKGIEGLKGRTPEQTLMNLVSFLTVATNTSNAIEKTLGQRQKQQEERAQQPLRTSKNPTRPQSSRQGTLGLFGSNI